MQIGGIGIITLSIFLISFFTEFGLGIKVIAGQILDLESWRSVRQLIRFIIMITIVLELIGASILFATFRFFMPPSKAIFYSIFYAVSAFCNVGIGLFPDDLYQFQNNYTVLLTLMTLAFLGGFGFIAFCELIKSLKARYNRQRYLLSLQTKIILNGSISLVVAVSAICWLLEHNHIYPSMPSLQKAINIIFQASSFRGMGFSSIPIELFHLSTVIIFMIVAFIGSSPASTGGGIRITTLVLYLATIKAGVLGNSSVNVKGRLLPKELIFKAIAIISLGFFWIIATTFLLLITEADKNFLPLLFESVSAFANVGISFSVTPTLSTLGKLLIIANMLAGKIGILTLVLAVLNRSTKSLKYTDFSFPEERVMLG